MRQFRFTNHLKWVAFGAATLCLVACQSATDPKLSEGKSVPVTATIAGSGLSAAKNALFAVCTQLGFKVVSSGDPLLCQKTQLTDKREAELMLWLGTQIIGVDNSYNIVPKEFVSFALAASGSDVRVTATSYASVLDLGETPRKYNLSDEMALQHMKALLKQAGGQ